jgi:glycosyltransferase involved in cell wall biosynthesis
MPSQPRKILAAGASRGGVSDVFRRVGAELRQRGHDVEVIDLPASRTAAGQGIRGVFAAREALRAAHTVHLEFGSNDIETFWFALGAVLLRRNCVVVAHDYPKLIHTPAAGLVPTSLRCGSAVGYRVLSPLLDSFVTRMLVRRAAAIVVFGEEARTGLLARGARHVHVVRHGGDAATEGTPRPSEGEYILFAGFLDPGKGIDILLEAWALISDRADLPLVLAGHPHDPWFHETLQRFTGLRNPPQMMGPLPEESSFQALIGRAAMVVLPYRYSSPASGVLVRAMSAGRPVIATPVPATRDVVRNGENGVVVPIGDVRALAQAIDQLCGSPGDRDRLGDAAAATAARMFSWREHVDGLEAAYGLARTATPRGASTGS